MSLVDEGCDVNPMRGPEWTGAHPLDPPSVERWFYPALCEICGHHWEAASTYAPCPECGADSLDVAHGPLSGWTLTGTPEAEGSPVLPTSGRAGGRGFPLARALAAIRRHWLRLLVGAATGAYVAFGLALGGMVVLVAQDVTVSDYHLALALDGLLCGFIVAGALAAYHRRGRS